MVYRLASNNISQRFFGEDGRFCWLYLYDDSLAVPDGFDIIDFEGGLYAVATDIDQQTDMEAMQREVNDFLIKNGFAHDESRDGLGNIITSPLAAQTPWIFPNGLLFSDKGQRVVLQNYFYIIFPVSGRVWVNRVDAVFSVHKEHAR